MITNLLAEAGFFDTVLAYIVVGLLWVYDSLFYFYNLILGLFNVPLLDYDKTEDLQAFTTILIIAGAVIVGLIILAIIVKICKKKKVKFYDGNNKIAKVKVKSKKEISFPEAPEKEGKVFIGWFKDKNFKKPYTSKVLLKNKNLKLYARYIVKAEKDEPIKENSNPIVPPIAKPVPPIGARPMPVKPTIQPIKPMSATQPQASAIVKEEKDDIANVTSTQLYEKEGLAKFDVLGDEKVLGEPLSENAIVEERIALKKEEVKLDEFYDNIRYEMLTYERALPFKNLGVIRKQVIAEMFERDNKIYLYLAVDPALMKEKGYNVIGHDELEFSIVPCLKEIATKQDYEEALKLINEAMVLNNFIKSEVVFAQKIKSDEVTRKNGFAFYVKNDNVVTSANHYYNFMRAIVLSYKVSVNRKYPASLDNKMILKIFKKEERIFIYLALDADAEGLEFVGYDKNFVDTSAMFEIKTAEDCVKANALIDKLMYRFGMEKCPEQVDVSLDEVVDTNCGFGYRIRR